MPDTTLFDCVVMTSMEQTTDLLQSLEGCVDDEKIVVPEMLVNMKYRDPSLHEQEHS